MNSASFCLIYFLTDYISSSYYIFNLSPPLPVNVNDDDSNEFGTKFIDDDTLVNDEKWLYCWLLLGFIEEELLLLLCRGGY